MPKQSVNTKLSLAFALLLLLIVVTFSLNILSPVRAQDSTSQEGTISALSTEIFHLKATVAAIQLTPSNIEYCIFCINIIQQDVTPAVSTATPTPLPVLPPTPTFLPLETLYEDNFDTSNSWVLEQNTSIANGVLETISTGDANSIVVPFTVTNPFQLTLDIKLPTSNTSASILYGDIANQQYFYLLVHSSSVDVYQVRGQSEQFMQTFALPQTDWTVFQTVEINIYEDRIIVSINGTLLGLAQVNVVGNQIALGITSSIDQGTSKVFFDNLKIRRLKP